MRPRDQTVRLVLHQFLRTTGIGNDNWQSGRLCFENYVAECVGGAGKNKNIRRCVRGSQFRAPEITGKKRLRQRFREGFGIRAMTDDKKLNR